MKGHALENPPLFVSVGECMAEIAPAGGDLYRLGYAGDSFNAAWTARQLLPAPCAVRYVTAVGRDHASDALVSFIEGAAIDATHVIRDTSRTLGLYMVHLDEGERSFSYWRRGSAATKLADDRSALDAAFLGASMIFFSGITLAILSGEARATLFAALGSARKAGTRIAFDPNYRSQLWPDLATAKVTLSEAIGLAHIVLPTFEDEATLFGDASPAATVDRMLALGCSEIVVKNGALPATLFCNGSHHSVPAKKAVEVIDTTGAGDGFNGAYLAARMRGVEAQDAAVLAHEAAAVVVGNPGALAPLGALSQLLD